MLGIGKATCFTFISGTFKTTGDHNKSLPTHYYAKTDFNYKALLQTKDGRLMSDEELMRKQPLIYCLMVCNKIGYYMKKIYKVDLMRV